MSLRRIIFSATGATTSPPQNLAVTAPTDFYGNGNVAVQGLITQNQYRYYNDGDSVTFVAPATNADGGAFAFWDINGSFTLTASVTLTISENAGAIANYKSVNGGLSARMQQQDAGGQGMVKVSVYENGLPGFEIQEQLFVQELHAIVIGGSGSYSYLWSTGDTTAVITVPNTFVGSNIIISCRITDNGTAEQITFYQRFLYREDIQFNLAIVQPTCGAGNGTVTVTVDPQDVSGTMSYLWSNGNTGNVYTNTFPVGSSTPYFIFTDGVISVRVYFTIIGVAALAIVVTGSDSTDVLVPNGYALVNATGGAEPYSYLWNNGGTGPQINGLVAGIYTVVVTDANGCTQTDSVSINQPNVGSNYYEIQAAASKAECCSGKLAMEIIDQLELGERVCLDDEMEFLYITNIAYILRNYIPAGTIMVPAIFSFAEFTMPSDTEFSDIVIVVDGVTVLSASGLFLLTLQDLIDYIIANIGGGFTASNPSTGELLITAPDETYNGDLVTVDYTGKLRSTHLEETLDGGEAQVVKTQEENCLTPEQINKIISNVNQACGCCTSFAQVVTTGASSGIPFIPGGGGRAARAIWVTAGQFSGNDVVIPQLIGLKIITDFEISTGGVGQSGTLVYPPYYDLDNSPAASLTGTLTFPNGPEGFRILIY